MKRLTHRNEDGKALVWVYADPEKPAEVIRAQLKAAVQRCAEAQAEIVRMCDHWNMKLRKETEKKGD